MEDTTKGHKRCKSDSDVKRMSKILGASNGPKLGMGELSGSIKAKKQQSLSSEVQSSLKQEVLYLQKQLEAQPMVSSALEKGLTKRPLSQEPSNKDSSTKPAKDLINEIAVLELEVVNLEKYLLSLYRKTFDERVSCISRVDSQSKPKAVLHKGMYQKVPGHDITTKNEILGTKSSHFLLPRDLVDNTVKESGETSGARALLDPSILRSHSSLSLHSACTFRNPPMGTVAEAVHSCHSLPLSMLEFTPNLNVNSNASDQRARGATMNATSLAQHLGTSLETPNWLSEEMIKCISAIYIELADPPSIDHGFPLSPVSSSSVADSSPQHQSNIWSPETRKNPSFYSSMESAFSTEGSNELGGAYSTMIEVQRICRDGQSLKRVKNMLQQFRSFVLRLEEVHPEKMRHEEKIAFWINVHNSLVMHAFLVYGIPQNNLKRISLLLKAAYNVGGHTISVDMIQNSILGCRLPRPGQWLQALFFPKAKSKSRDTWKASALKHPEPRLYFALCSGSHSDPAVRMYTPKGVFQELEAAKDDYIHTNLRVHKEHKILLPKLVDSFAKKSGLCPAAFMEMIEHFMPHSAKKRLIQQHRHGRFWKKIEWTPHNHSFRYLLGKELLK